MNCLQTKGYFSAHLEDTLDNQTLKQFESHIAECASCQKEYDRFQASVKATQQLPEIEPSPDFVPLLWQRISDERTKIIPLWQRLSDLFNIPKWAIGGVLILVLACAGTLFYYDDIFNTEPQPDNRINLTDNISTEKNINTTSDQIRSNIIDQFFPQSFPRNIGGSDMFDTNSNQPMQQQYILKRVSYTTPTLAGGL